MSARKRPILSIETADAEIDSMEAVSFLGGGESMPDEYRPDGKRVVIETKEFTLFEKWGSEHIQMETKWAPNIEREYWRSYTNKDQLESESDLDAILKTIRAFVMIEEFENVGGSATICSDLLDSVGPCLQRVASADDASQAEDAIKEVTDFFRKVVSGYARWKGAPLKDKKLPTTPTTHDVIWAAQWLIECSCQVPDQQMIQSLVEATGKQVDPKKGKKKAWAELFDKAGLSGFPEAADNI